MIHAALANHPAVRAQSGLGEAAQSGVEGAKWQYWPTPSIGVEQAGTNDPSYRGDKAVTILRIQQPLWSGGRLDGNLSKAEARVIAARADLEATRQQLALRVVQAWSDAAAAQGKLAAYKQSHDVHARLLALVERRTREGASANADIDLARSRLDSIEAELAATQAQRDTALDRLGLLTGLSVPVDALDQVARTSPPEPLIDLPALLSASREQSPQIAKARALANIAAADMRIARAALSPEVYLRAERQYGNFSLPGQAVQNRVFIGFTTAFGGGLSSLSSVDAAQAQYRAAQEDIQAQRLAIDEQVQGDATLYRTAVMRRTSLDRVLKSSVDVTDSWERQFLAGRKQWQDLMNATREQTQTDTQLADAIGAQQLAGWRLVILTRGVDAVLALPDQTNTSRQP